MAGFLSSAAISQMSEELPSIFPLLASDQLKSSIREAFNHVCRFLVNNYPEKFYWLQPWNDEFFTLIDSLLEIHFLQITQALFSENFYGLQRDTKSLDLKTLLIHIILPYFKTKILKMYENCVINGQEPIIPISHKSIYFLHKTSEMFHNSLDLVINLLYTIGLSRHHSLLHWLDSSNLVYAKSDQEENIQSKLAKLWFARRIFHKFFSIGIEISAFSLQFCNWWFAQSESRSNIFANLPIPDPPAKSEKYDNICPICRGRNIKTPTILSISGYVFCYKCIVYHIRQTGKCPISQMATNERHLIRLFQQ